MGSYKYTKFILLFLIIWLWASDGLKIKSKLNEDDNSQKTYSTTFYLTTEESDENERIMTNDAISPFPNDVKSICDTQRDSLYNTTIEGWIELSILINSILILWSWSGYIKQTGETTIKFTKSKISQSLTALSWSESITNFP